MKVELELVKEFHKKFNVPVLSASSNIVANRYELRHRLMSEEVAEYLDGAQRGDIANVAKELADILFAVYGTVLEHGLQDKMDDVFKEVCASNMTKEYNEYKMVKGEDYKEPDIDRFVI